MRRRTSDEGDFASMKRRTASRSWSCSSENAKFMISPSGSRLTREPEHPLGDDVALDLARPGVDRLGPAGHEDAVRLVDLVLAAWLALHEQRVRAQHLHLELAEVAVPGGPEQLADARLGPEHTCLDELRDHA